MTVRDLGITLDKTEDLKERVDLYNRFFALNRDDYPLDVLERMDSALQLCRQSAYTRGIFQAIIHRTYCYHQLSEKKKASEDISRLKQLYKDDSRWDRENMYYYHLLSLYYCDKKYPGLCTDYTLRCLSLARKLSDYRISASAQAFLGRMNFRMGLNGEAEANYFDALSQLWGKDDAILTGIVNCHLGNSTPAREIPRRRAAFITGATIWSRR